VEKKSDVQSMSYLGASTCEVDNVISAQAIKKDSDELNPFA